MPLRKYARKPRRPYVVRRRAARRTAMVARKRMYRPKLYRSIGIPKQMFAKLKYSTYENMSLAPLANTFFEYRLNSIFDPESKVGGGQPYYFDQYTAMYSRYLVYGCKASFTVCANSANTNIIYPSVVVVPYSGTTPAWASHLTMQDAKKAMWRRVIPGQNITTMTKYYNNADIAGVSKTTYNNDDLFNSAISTNPQNQTIVQINVQNYDAAATVVVQAFVKLTYYVKLYDIIEPPASS